MQVYYPFGGIKKVLRYKTHNEGAQIILANSDEQIKSIAATALNKYKSELWSFKFLDYWEIEIVSLPNWLCLEYCKFKKNEEIEDFLNSVCCQLADFIKNGINLPSQFESCLLKQEGQYHWNCQDEFGNIICRSGIKILNLSEEEFYNKYNQSWISKFPIKKYIDKDLKISKAKQAKEDDVVWAASPNFGHHSVGVEFKELSFDNCFFRENLFFFKKIKEFPLDDLNSLYENFVKDVENKKLQQSKISKEQRILKEKMNIDLILSVFN